MGIKVILNQFFYGGNRVVPDDIMETIRGEIHDGTNILYPCEIPITIPILECILKRNELTMYKGSIYFIYFKLNGGSFPHITTEEYNTMYDNRFCIPLDFEILESSLPLYQYGLGSHLTYELTFHDKWI